MTRLGRSEIAGLIPHRGAMCLLDEVLDWDARRILCRTDCALRPDNPLRRADGTLGAATGAELAAQAMALHGRLTAPAEGAPRSDAERAPRSDMEGAPRSDTEGAPRPGALVSLRGVRLFAALLPAAPLTIRAALRGGDEAGAVYEFYVECGEKMLVDGRAAVVFG